MTLSKIWVFAEAADGKVSPTTLEVLTKARELADTVEAVYVGGDADAVAGAARRPRRHHRPRHRRPRRRAARARPWPPPSPTPSRRRAPDAILFGTSYDGRDIVGRLSVKLDRTGAHQRHRPRASTATRSPVTTPVFGGTTNVITKFTGDGPGAGADPAEVVRGRGERRRARPPSSRWPSPTSARRRGAKITERHVEEREGPQLEDAAIVVSGGRGLGEAEKY